MATASTNKVPPPASGPLPVTETALTFLRTIGRRTIAAIDPHKDHAAPVCITPGHLQTARRWIADRNGRVNLYFTVNPTKKMIDRKPAETDIATFTFAHVDCDPLPGEPAAEARKRHRAALSALPYPPTLIWDSGNGVAALWQLKEPVKLVDAATIARCKAINVSLIAALGGKARGVDNCQNLDRLLRLPGTINIPDRRKRAAGRSLEMAGNLEHHPERIYSLSDLPTASAAVDQNDEPVIIGDSIITDDLGSLEISGRVKTIIAHGRVPGERKEGDDSRSAWECEAVCEMIRAGVADEIILGLLTDPRYTISERVLEKPHPETYAQQEIARLRKRIKAETRAEFHDQDGSSDGHAWRPSAKRPLQAAKEFRRRHHPTLIHQNEQWLVHQGSHYVEVEDATIRAQLYEFLSTGISPNQSVVANVVDALKAVAHVPAATFEPPCWLDGKGPFPAREILAFKDGLLHLPSMTFLAPTPNFFTRNALTYGYDAHADKPREWFKFLLGVFRGSRKSIGLLQEIFGYLLLPDTSLQKLFMWDGPPRGGKGTTLRIAEHLIGKGNCVSPTLAGIGKDPILASMVGKQLAIISDMRITGRTDLGAVAENLLRITGEDSVTFDRKYKDAWTGRLPVRFFILTNLPPNIPDVAGAMANRFIVLVSFQSWLGNEDPTLEARLLEELPGILLWAIDGWKRLRARGRFRQTPEGEAVLRRMIEAASPVRAFIREECTLERDATVSKEALHTAYGDWSCRKDLSQLGEAVFARNLLAVVRDKVRETKLRGFGTRIPTWRGIRLRDPLDHDAEDSANEPQIADATARGPVGPGSSTKQILFRIV